MRKLIVATVNFAHPDVPTFIKIHCKMFISCIYTENQKMLFRLQKNTETTVVLLRLQD